MAKTPEEMVAGIDALMGQLPEGMPITRALFESLKGQLATPPTDPQTAIKFAGNVALEAARGVALLEARVFAIEAKSSATDLAAVSELLNRLFPKK